MRFAIHQENNEIIKLSNLRDVFNRLYYWSTYAQCMYVHNVSELLYSVLDEKEPNIDRYNPIVNFKFKSILDFQNETIEALETGLQTFRHDMGKELKRLNERCASRGLYDLPPYYFPKIKITI